MPVYPGARISILSSRQRAIIYPVASVGAVFYLSIPSDSGSARRMGRAVLNRPISYPEHASVDMTLPAAELTGMATGNRHLRSLRREIQTLSNAERSHMCWELGYFQTPMFVKERGERPAKPYMLVCIGSSLLLDPPSPQDLLSLFVASMEKPCVGIVAPILPESVRVDDSAAFDLLRSELGQLGVKVELVEKLSALLEFKEIADRELFSHQVRYSAGEN